jgi:transcriptional regulator with XRE-family HTH domain
VTSELKDRLRLARKQAGITQAQLADLAGMTQTTISYLEIGKCHSTTFCARIANACGVDALWLETGQGDMHTGESGNSHQIEPLVFTARDLIAIEAMQVVAPRHTKHDTLARDAYALADAMLRARKVTQ